MTSVNYSRESFSTMRRGLGVGLILLAVLSFAGAAFGASPKELDWDDLVPPDWDPNSVFDQYTADEFASMPDEEYIRLREKAQALLDAAPTVDSLDGELVKIPGFMLPLDFSSTEIKEFLLVPYFGACIHTPPPPANQIIHGVLDSQFFTNELFEPVWISGKLRILRATSTLGESGFQQTLDIETGYAMDVELVEPYVYSE